MKCNVYYVGQTVNIKQRIANHKTAIKNYSAIIQRYKDQSNNYCVAKHFYTNSHIIERDFRFCVFRENINDLEERLSIENDLIHILILLNYYILNDYIPNQLYCKKLSFLF